EGHAPDQGALVSRGRRREVLLSQLRLKKSIDAKSIDAGPRPRLHRLKGPELASLCEIDTLLSRRGHFIAARVGRSNSDPLAEIRDLLIAQLTGGRHLQ